MTKRFTLVGVGEDLVELNDNGIYKVFTDIGLEKLLNEQHEQIEKMKSKGLKVLDFYLEKLKTTDDFQGVRDEIWIVKQVLTEMDVINDD